MGRVGLGPPSESSTGLWRCTKLFDPDDRNPGLTYEATPCLNGSEGGPRPTLRDIATRYVDDSEGGLRPTLRDIATRYVVPFLDVTVSQGSARGRRVLLHCCHLSTSPHPDHRLGCEMSSQGVAGHNSNDAVRRRGGLRASRPHSHHLVTPRGRRRLSGSMEEDQGRFLS